MPFVVSQRSFVNFLFFFKFSSFYDPKFLQFPFSFLLYSSYHSHTYIDLHQRFSRSFPFFTNRLRQFISNSFFRILSEPFVFSLFLQSTSKQHLSSSFTHGDSFVPTAICGQRRWQFHSDQHRTGILAFCTYYDFIILSSKLDVWQNAKFPEACRRYCAGIVRFIQSSRSDRQAVPLPSQSSRQLPHEEPQICSEQLRGKHSICTLKKKLRCFEKKTISPFQSCHTEFQNLRKNLDVFDKPFVVENAFLSLIVVVYQTLDASRTWICFWSLNGLRILDAEIPEETQKDIIRFIKSCEDPEGGYGGSNLSLSRKMSNQIRWPRSVCSSGTDLRGCDGSGSAEERGSTQVY